jgi:hypothetical protein
VCVRARARQRMGRSFSVWFSFRIIFSRVPSAFSGVRVSVACSVFRGRRAIRVTQQRRERYNRQRLRAAYGEHVDPNPNDRWTRWPGKARNNIETWRTCAAIETRRSKHYPANRENENGYDPVAIPIRQTTHFMCIIGSFRVVTVSPKFRPERHLGCARDSCRLTILLAGRPPRTPLVVRPVGLLFHALQFFSHPTRFESRNVKSMEKWLR